MMNNLSTADRPADPLEYRKFIVEHIQQAIAQKKVQHCRINLTPGEMMRLLDKLDNENDDFIETGTTRSHERIPQPMQTVLVNLDDGLMLENVFMKSRNISKEGFGLLHTQHVEPMTRVNLFLQRLDKKYELATGIATHCALVSCSYLRENLYTLGVKLDHQLHIDDYL